MKHLSDRVNLIANHLQVTSHLGNLVERERAMTKLLNNGPEEHLDLVEKMQKGLKVRRIDDDLATAQRNLVEKRRS